MLKPPHTAELSFQLVDEIGQEGRNSAVFTAKDLQLDADIVVKRIPKNTITDIDEYFTEAALLYLSAHPNVAPIHYACHDNDHIFLAMPHFRKGSLKRLMARGSLTVREIVVFSTQMLSGLHNIHSKGLVHFDVKPDNVLLSDRGEALISDFGLAKQISFNGVAEQDRIYGIMHPPEAFVGNAFTRQFDIYQAGLTIHRMCVGDDVFYAEFASFKAGGVLDRHRFRHAVLNGQFPRKNADDYPEHIPQALVTTIRECVHTDLNQRYKSAIDVVNALANIDEKLLDWRMQDDATGRSWRKQLGDGREIQLTINGNGSSHAVTRDANGKERRITKYCQAQLNRAQIKSFLREH